MNKTRFVSILLIFAIFSFTLTACGQKENIITTKDYDSQEYENTDLGGVVAQNSEFSLSWDNENKKVIYCSLKNGVTYTTSPADSTSEPQLDADGMPIKNNPQVESAISVTYYDSIAASEQTLYSYNGAVRNGNIYTEKVENGIRVIYDFTEKEISVPVDYTIDKNCFKISVDTAEIGDSEEYPVTGVSIAPFICGIKNDSQNDSYLFIPDGSGALIYPKTTDTVGTFGSIPVYGGDNSIRTDEFHEYSEQCYMPIYGMKSGDNGLFAIINSAAERASINYSIGSSNIRYSSVYPYFRIKNYNLVDSPMKVISQSVMQFNENITDEPLTVSFYPLFGDNCGYNDMAKIYRDYLTESYGLKEKNSAPIKLSLEIEGGIENKKFFCGIPYTGFNKLTTVSEAKEIAEYFDYMSENLLVRLSGFGDNGLNTGKLAGGFEINSKLGNGKEISELVNFCKKSKINLSLDFDTISFNKSGNGFSIMNSVSSFSDGEPGYIQMYNNVTGTNNGTRIYLLSRALIPQVLERINGKMDEYGFRTVGLGKLGSFIYSDFNNSDTYNCNGIQEKTIEQINSVRSKRSVVLTGANDYAASVCDYIAGVPVNSSGYDFYMYDIPFYSMVFKGYVQMVSKAVNLSADTDEFLLSCIEAGVSPSYTIINNFTKETINSEFAVTRSSLFSSIREDIKADIEKLSDYFENTSKARIINHNVLSKSLRMIEYDNGVTVYVNYGNSEVMLEGTKIPAKGYKILEG